VNQSAREEDGETDGLGWGTPESGEERDFSGEILEIDELLDPQAPEPEHVATIYSYESLAALAVRQHVKRSDDQLRFGVRSVLESMESPPQGFGKDQAVRDEHLLEHVMEHILNANEFVTGSFQNSVAAWEELLGGSKRQSSKKVLKWVREGVRPIFEGTKSAEPKKLKRVRGLLRRAVPKGQVEEFLSGEVPHKIEFENHQSVYDHLPFYVKAVKNLVITGTAYLYKPGEPKPKVVNPLGVALNANNERLVLNGMYINSFMKSLPFKYERLRIF
jgi:hypothetical protein